MHRMLWPVDLLFDEITEILKPGNYSFPKEPGSLLSKWFSCFLLRWRVCSIQMEYFSILTKTYLHPHEECLPSSLRCSWDHTTTVLYTEVSCQFSKVIVSYRTSDSFLEEYLYSVIESANICLDDECKFSNHIEFCQGWIWKQRCYLLGYFENA